MLRVYPPCPYRSKVLLVRSSIDHCVLVDHQNSRRRCILLTYLLQRAWCSLKRLSSAFQSPKFGYLLMPYMFNLFILSYYFSLSQPCLILLRRQRIRSGRNSVGLSRLCCLSDWCFMSGFTKKEEHISLGWMLTCDRELTFVSCVYCNTFISSKSFAVEIWCQSKPFIPNKQY